MNSASGDQWQDVGATRLRGVGTTIFSEMTALARRTGAINLGQGFPDTDGPPGMLAAARDAITAGFNQYPPIDGVPELRAAIADVRSSRYGTRIDPDREILVTMGATEAISAALIGLCEPGGVCQSNGSSKIFVAGDRFGPAAGDDTVVWLNAGTCRMS
jgi:N-succinyldiaminopimelate aminotransferase